MLKYNTSRVAISTQLVELRLSWALNWLAEEVFDLEFRTGSPTKDAVKKIKIKDTVTFNVLQKHFSNI